MPWNRISRNYLRCPTATPPTELGHHRHQLTTLQTPAPMAVEVVVAEVVEATKDRDRLVRAPTKDSPHLTAKTAIGRAAVRYHPPLSGKDSTLLHTRESARNRLNPVDQGAARHLESPVTRLPDQTLRQVRVVEEELGEM